MTNLTLVNVAYENDLPPKWEGREVEWKGWQFFWTSAVLHYDDACHLCGAVVTQSNVGIVENPGEFYRKHRHKVTDPETGRTRLTRGTKAPMYPTMRLVAYRCQCGHVEVWDTETQEMWCLEESDYGDGGSDDPIVQAALGDSK